MPNIHAKDALTRSEKMALWIAGVFTLQSLIGYAIFGLHPDLLARVPGAIAIFNVAFVVFAQAQIWLSFLALVYVLSRRMGGAWLPAFAVVYTLSLGSELLGTSTGLPFGQYAYTELLGPKWLGLVPNLIPISWFMLGIVFYWLAYAITGRAWFAAVWMAAALTVWDFVLDPAMSYYTSYWIWHQPGSYYGMPWINSFGWFVTGLVVGAALSLVGAGSLARRLPQAWAWTFVAINVLLPFGMVAVNGGWSALALFTASAAILALALRVYRSESASHKGGGLRAASNQTPGASASLVPAMVRVQQGLRRAMQPLVEQGMTPINLEGQLLRPLAAYSVAQSMNWEPEAEDPFWYGALAIQLAHEASLAHDDILDNATLRRGMPTLNAKRGIGQALVIGDQWLTWSYRAAHMSGSAQFAEHFARAVERTVHGEMAQARSAGQAVSEQTYIEIVRGKSGELFAAAMALAPIMRGSDGQSFAELGLHFGEVYQRLDDLLDYLPAAQTGKPAYQDARQHKWTWPVQVLGAELLGQNPAQIAARMQQPSYDALQKLLSLWHTYSGQVSELRGEMFRLLGSSPALVPILVDWESRAREAINCTLEQSPARRSSFAHNSRSFAFAARLLPQMERDAVADLYSFCRFTDNLADSAMPVAERKLSLERWRAVVIRAFERSDSGLDFLDRLGSQARRAGVPLDYPLELLQGAAMDLEGRTYGNMAQLRRYTYRVAGVLGQWLCRLAGVNNPAVLQAAAEMGHAMQLTNILRDVGEDRAMGRVYIPMDILESYGVDAAHTSVASPGYQAMVRELIQQARQSYDAAFAALAQLPAAYAYSFAAAAYVYRAILDQIEAQGYDNLSQRASTGAGAKISMALRAVVRLAVLRRGHGRRPISGISTLTTQ